LKAPHSKCGIRATVSGVRIPPSPPNYIENIGLFDAFGFLPIPPPIAQARIGVTQRASEETFPTFEARYEATDFAPRAVAEGILQGAEQYSIIRAKQRMPAGM
jgi:hypothetical protein